ncbi:hypothetical protein QC761_603335 [Podospora bellae-mahoneyi]|uniref:Uncharacterized protein n=1 Tax=Podospora bellae-mahoneyi TaxID=2093777 RepID=A0ABR0FCE2_9PEZI|nr:hypothetical protein QC761_603335 [Podospora bellae-mahoneyi]
MQLLAPVLFVTATLAAACTEQQPFRRQVGSNSTLVVVQAAETGAFRAGAPLPTDGLGAGRFAGDSGSGFFEVSGAPSSTFTAIGGLLGVVGAVVGGVMLL